MNKRSVLCAEDAIFSRQKRWLSESGIIAAIDAKRAEQRSMMEMAQRLEEAHKSGQLGLSNESDVEMMFKLNQTRGFGFNDYKDASEFLFRKAERMEDRIKELGHKLAAFRTELLSFTNDRAVV